MKKFIVITSIFPPTEAVISFAKMNDYKLVVVGDKKTPADWSCKNVEYLSMQRQSETGTYLHKVLPYNHYGRKMMGYLFSINKQADLIVDTDDDNIPKQDWSFPSFKGDFPSITEKGFVNIYQLYTDKKIWPRGLPLRHISTKYALEQQLKNKKCKVGIWQGLADEDPDVDAIYRLTSDELCYFKERSEPVVLSAGTVSPFNSQNTMFAKNLFPLMYLPCLVTFRFTDILRGLIAQPIMWLDHYNLGFTNATVIQKKTPIIILTILYLRYQCTNTVKALLILSAVQFLVPILLPTIYSTHTNILAKKILFKHERLIF